MDHLLSFEIILLTAVQECSSSKRKEMWKTIQIKANSSKVVQLILNMKVWWSSMHLMLDQAEKNKDVHNKILMNDQPSFFFLCSVLMLLLMSFDGKNTTLLSVIKFVSSSSRVRSGHESKTSLVY